MIVEFQERETALLIHVTDVVTGLKQYTFVYLGSFTKIYCINFVIEWYQISPRHSDGSHIVFEHAKIIAMYGIPKKHFFMIF